MDIAQVTDQKIEYSKHKGLDDKKCEALLLDSLKDHGSLTKPEIVHLLWDVLPDQHTFIMEDIQEKYNHLLQQNDAVYSPFTFPSVKLSIEERVAIFHSLFKGREDVFAQRWFSKTTAKSGYQPVCINEWRRGVCDKKKFKCANTLCKEDCL